MKDVHLTSALDHPPYRQYRIAELELPDLQTVGEELAVVLKSCIDPGDYSGFEDYLGAGRIAIASRLTAMEAPHGPTDIEIEAVAVGSLRRSVPRVYRRNNDTPDELVRYLESYMATADPEHVGPSLRRMLPANESGNERSYSLS